MSLNDDLRTLLNVCGAYQDVGLGYDHKDALQALGRVWEAVDGLGQDARNAVGEVDRFRAEVTRLQLERIGVATCPNCTEGRLVLRGGDCLHKDVRARYYAECPECAYMGAPWDVCTTR